MPRIAWENRAQAKRTSLYAAIPMEWRLKPTEIPSLDGTCNVSHLPRKFLSELEIAITESKPFDVLTTIHAGVWSARNVTEAYCHRAAIAHQLVNCLTEILFDTAMEQASQLDQHRLATGGLRGPLHGLPVSFMDRFRVAGAQTAAGYIGWLGKTEDEESESHFVKQMRSFGAIPFCKTNMPMSMMLGETSNNITGSTMNPFVRGLSSGGAAGGEGALLAMKASPLGFATDIAGSARIPAAFNGLYSLRPSAGRLSTRGVATSMQGVPVCGHVTAPMSADLALLKYLMKCVIGGQSSLDDPSLIDLSWRVDGINEIQPVPNSRPTFAVLHCDGNVAPHPPIQRALNMVVGALQRRGYEVVDWQPPPHAPAVQTLFEILGSDGARGIRTALRLSGEPAVPQLETWYSQQDSGPLPTTEFWELCQKRVEYLSGYQKYWKSTKHATSSQRPVDGVILPVAANAAAKENSLNYFAYSAIVNFLDYSAGTFPVTKVDRNQDLKFPYKPFNADDRAVWEQYEAEVFDGAPVGLQVMCRRLQEEKMDGNDASLSYRSGLNDHGEEKLMDHVGQAVPKDATVQINRLGISTKEPKTRHTSYILAESSIIRDIIPTFRHKL